MAGSNDGDAGAGQKRAANAAIVDPSPRPPKKTKVSTPATAAVKSAGKPKVAPPRLKPPPRPTAFAKPAAREVPAAAVPAGARAPPPPTRHPAVFGSADKQQKKEDVLDDELKLIVGTLVFAIWPVDKHYHLATLVVDDAAPAAAVDVPVLFFQDPGQESITQDITARVNRKTLIIAPVLPAAPQYIAGEKKEGQEAEEAWWNHHLSTEADIKVGDAVAANYTRSVDRNENNAFLIGEVTKVCGLGWSVKIHQRAPGGKAVLLERQQMKTLYFGSPLAYTRGGGPIWPDPKDLPENAPKTKARRSGEVLRPAKRLNGAVEGSTFTQKNNAGQWRVQSGWKSILGMKSLDSGPDNDPTVSARVMASDTPGPLDASDPKTLVTWKAAADRQRFQQPDITVLISEHFSVEWHMAKHKGADGIQVKVQGDGASTVFGIDVREEKAAKRCMRAMKKKLEHAHKEPQLYTGNAKSVKVLEE
ncbi:hypothetical protein LTR36_010183 [Oleoguttula mirabilis]|uniref:Uncharacterized protein n=1 Tax=Oleoguttula mirabilis TaxID=1507867 RepID=A0AAV9JRT1_9PEZI|nr:hypothetical protein LTR36_010183 [Oleoguttula mirabilis]